MNHWKDYLTDTAVLRRVTGMNEFGEPITESLMIKVRWEGKRRLVRDKQGKEVVSEARVFCLDDVQPGDILVYGGREWPVIAVSTITDLDGNLVYQEVAC